MWKFLSKLLRALQQRGVGYGKDIWRNLEAAAGENKVAFDWLDNNVAKPIEQAKAAYTNDVITMLEEYKQSIDKYGIKKGSKESKATQWFGEGVKEDGTKYTLSDLKQDHPDNWQNIVEFNDVNRKIYDNLLTQLNNTLETIYPNALENALNRANKMEADLNFYQNKMDALYERLGFGEDVEADIRSLGNTIKMTKGRYNSLIDSIQSGDILRNKRVTPRKDYYHHFSEVLEGIQGIRNIMTTSQEIDPRLASMSEYTKPKSKWAGFMQQRKGGKYKADAVASMLTYLPAAQYKIHFDPVIARLRGTVSSLAEATTNTRNANKVIELLTEYTNSLAGKTNFIDRAVQKVAGRKLMALLGSINSRVKANAVLGNFRSALIQIGNIPNAMAYITNPKSWAKGTINTLFNDSSKMSPFIRERYMGDLLDEFDPKFTPKRFAKWLLQVGDEKSARLIWNTAYQEALRNGHQDPIRYADSITRKSMAGRGIGELPLTQESKVLGIAGPFQVEVNNTYNVIKDTVKKQRNG